LKFLLFYVSNTDNSAFLIIINKSLWKLLHNLNYFTKSIYFFYLASSKNK